VTREAQLLRRLDEIRVVLSPMDVVAAEARDAAPIHQAFDEVVGLRLGDATQADRQCRDDDVEDDDSQPTGHAETHQRADERVESIGEQHADEDRDEDRFAFSQHEDGAGYEKQSDR